MSVKNRNEAISQVNTKIVPKVRNTTHRDLLNNDILNSIQFRKDVIGTATPSGGNVTADFTNYDLVTVSTSDNLVVSFSGLENGDVKYLQITKPLTKSITFSGATDLSAMTNVITDLFTVAVYQIVNKNNVIYSIIQQNTILRGSFADIQNSVTTKIPTCQDIKSFILLGSYPEQTTWQTATLLYGSGIVSYRKTNKCYLEIYIETLSINFTTNPFGQIFQLPTEYTPSKNVRGLIQYQGDCNYIEINGLDMPVGLKGLVQYAGFGYNTLTISDNFISVPLMLP